MVPAVDSVDYGYDSRGLLSSVTSGDYASAYDYRTNGRLLSTVHSQLSTPAGDILRTDRSYDAGARLLGVANTAANNDQAGVVYTLGLDDQRTEALEETGQKWEYGYDGLKQLVTAKKTDTQAVVVSPLDQSYSYDPMGNRTAYTDTTGSTAYTANNANQYTTVGGIASTYDANGNLLSDGVKNYAWDAENQLIAVTPVSPVEGAQKVEYTYDWRMRRSGKKSYTYTSGSWVLAKTTGFKYHEWNPIEETITAANGATEKKNYIWGNDLSGNLHGAGGVGGLLSMKYNGDSFFYGFDGNGNVRALVKADSANPAASAVVERYAYDGFGRELPSSTPVANRLSLFAFSTKYLDAETGMNYYGYRYYSADAGRWINRDPIAESGGFNVYSFVGNDGLVVVDVLGLDWWLDLQINLLDGAIVACEFCAGASDSLTFGASEVARNAINNGLNGDGDYVIQNKGVYKAGEYTEIAVELTLTGGGAALKSAARKAVAAEVAAETGRLIAKGVARDEAAAVASRTAMERLTRAARAEARGIVGAAKGEVVHHVNTLVGHPAIPGVGSVQSHFPTIGVTWLANNPRNLMIIKKGESAKHIMLHRRAWFAEQIAVNVAHPALTASRVVLNEVRDSEFEVSIDVKSTCQ